MQITSIRYFVWLVLLVNLACQKTAADPRPAPPMKTVVTDATLPTTRHRKTDPHVETWLDRIDSATAAIKTLDANLVYDRVQQLVGDRQRRFGTLLYVAGPPGRFAVHFNRLLVDRRLDHDDRHYIFDGQWLIERYDREKLFIKRQLAPPPSGTDTPAQSADPLMLGTGPFIIPIRLNKTSLLQRFDVQLIPDSAEHPDTLHFRLLPKAEYPCQYTDIQLWYDRQTLLPIRIHTADESENESIVVLKNMRLNAPIDRTRIDPETPTEPGWRIEIQPWKTGPRPHGNASTK